MFKAVATLEKSPYLQGYVSVDVYCPPDRIRHFQFRLDGEGEVEEGDQGGRVVKFCNHPGKGTDMEHFLLQEVRVQELTSFCNKRSDGAAVFVVLMSTWAEKPKLLRLPLDTLVRKYERKIVEMYDDDGPLVDILDNVC
jgi:hypothetical protein